MMRWRTKYKLRWRSVSKSVYNEWVAYPTGKIDTGAWCDCCKRFNARATTVTVIGVRKTDPKTHPSRRGPDPSIWGSTEVLMILRKTDPQKGWWGLVGGYIDWGETVEECARREFMEETGREIGELTLLGVYSDPGRDLDGRQNVDHCYFGEAGAKVSELDAVEVEKVGWFTFDALPEKIAFDHGKMIADYRKLQQTRNR